MCHLLYEHLLTSRVPTRVGESPLPSVDQLSHYLLSTVTLSVYLSVRLLVQEFLKALKPGMDEGFSGCLLNWSENENRSQTKCPVCSSP